VKNVEVWTVGHSTHEADDFIKLLQGHGINMLIDVRTKPSSRKPHFVRDNLIRLVRGNGIDYRFGGTVLGGLNKVKIGEKLFITKMDTIVGFAEDGLRVAMMCSEGKPCECHRAGKLTAWLHRHREHVRTTHILTDGSTVDAREYEPQVKKVVVWPEFETDAKGKLIL
jgi:uncharacterized protein (DUF488 family)